MCPLSSMPWNGYEAKLFQVEFSSPTRWGRRVTSRCLTLFRTLTDRGWAASSSCPPSVARSSGLRGSWRLSVSPLQFSYFPSELFQKTRRSAVWVCLKFFEKWERRDFNLHFCPGCHPVIISLFRFSYLFGQSKKSVHILCNLWIQTVSNSVAV